ncbi:serine/threonine protein kinase [Trypanosoma grayi]|uniref:serine/threonine protein kinase n=1 Tax=Trypanosoma grayi TaxID=71804 RepID=UPI0004F46948|nr:serine/threonine protein kinase [Trypanosoma grayi]KEG11632.1 serine/threonine protein kinase [Trypanosoma grayi]
MYATRRKQGAPARAPFRLSNPRRLQTQRGISPAGGTLRLKLPSESTMLPSVRYAAHLTKYEKSEIQGYTDVCYVGQNCQSKIPAPVEGGFNSGYDDERGDYVIKLHDHIAYRYEVLSPLGSGSFGQVVKAADHLKGTTVALKIIRNKKRFTAQAKVEVQILMHLRKGDPVGQYGIVQALDSFSFRSHMCITYELLSLNLYEHMKQRNFHPLSVNVVRKIGAGVLVSLSYMWRENVIHCDLKPENILLKAPDRAAVKVIDLGSACFENARIYTYIQSRFYRAPEVILGCPYTKRIDLWSYGCVLCELATGFPIFPGESEQEQLACIMEYLGPPPREMLLQSPRRHEFFDANANYAPKLVPNSKRRIRYPGTKSLAAFLGLPDTDGFVSFIRQFLCWVPDERVPPRKAMRHEWIASAFEDPPSQPPPPLSAGVTRLAVLAATMNDYGATASPCGVPHLPKIGPR